MRKPFTIELGELVSDISYCPDEKCLGICTSNDLDGNVSDHFNKLVEMAEEIESIWINCSELGHLNGLDLDVLKNVKKMQIGGFSRSGNLDLMPWLEAMPLLEELNAGSGVKINFSKAGANSNLKDLSLSYDGLSENIGDISSFKKLIRLGLEVKKDVPTPIFIKKSSIKELKLCLERGVQEPDIDFSLFPELRRLWLVGFKKQPDLTQNNHLRQLIVAGSPKLKSMTAPNDNVTVCKFVTSDILGKKLW